MLQFNYNGWDITIRGAAPTRTVKMAATIDPTQQSDFLESHFGDTAKDTDQELARAVAEHIDDLHAFEEQQREATALQEAAERLAENRAICQESAMRPRVYRQALADDHPKGL